VLDFGLGELLLLGAVALIVLGPEKLPHAARMAGAWYGRIRRTLSNVQAEIAKEVHLSEMRQQMNDEVAKIHDAKDNFTYEMREMSQHLEIQPYSATIETDQTTSAIKSQETDWSQGIEAPLKSNRHGYYFFFVPRSMYPSLIPLAPYLPKSHIVQNKRINIDSMTTMTTDSINPALFIDSISP
jgi:sec-independent protein translocase protein TatB